jgi:hypothetical protein
MINLLVNDTGLKHGALPLMKAMLSQQVRQQVIDILPLR